MNYFHNKLHGWSLTVFWYASAGKRKRLKNLTEFTQKKLVKESYYSEIIGLTPQLY